MLRLNQRAKVRAHFFAAGLRGLVVLLPIFHVVDYHPFVKANIAVLPERVALARLFEATLFVVHGHAFIFAQVFLLQLRLLIRKGVSVVVAVVAGEETFAKIVIGPIL